MFMTERGDPRGVFDVVYGCNPKDDSLQLELATPEQGTSGVKGDMGVRPFNGDLDFRWQPIGTTGMILLLFSLLLLSYLPFCSYNDEIVEKEMEEIKMKSGDGKRDRKRDKDIY